MISREALGALSEPDFRRLYAARALSLLGDGLVPVALAFAVLQLSRSPSALGFVLASRSLALIVMLLVGGVIADRFPRKRVLIGSDLVRLLAQGATAALLLTGSATVWMIGVLAVVYGAGQAFFLPTVTGITPSTVSANRLQQANALVALTTSTFTVLGPVFAGVLIAVVGPGWAIAADAVTFAGSACLLARLPVRATLRRSGTRMHRELAAGWVMFRSHSWLWIDAIFCALGCFAILAPLLSLGPVVAQRSLDGAASWATIMTGYGLGSVCAAAVLLRARPDRPLLAGVSLLALLALPTGLLAIPASTAVITIGAFAGGAGLTAFNTLFESTIQQHIPASALSRVAAIDWLLSGSLQPVGYAIAGPLAGAIGLHAALAASATWAVLSTAAVISVPSVRNVRRRASDPTAPSMPESAAA